MNKNEGAYTAIIAILTVSLLINFYFDFSDSDEISLDKVAEGVINSCLEIRCDDDRASASAGTGYVVKYGSGTYVISNAHVVTFDNSGSYESYGSIKARYYNSSTEYPLSIISFDTNLDIAVMTFESEGFRESLSFGDSNKLRYGQTVFTIGNAMGYGLSLTDGVVAVPLINVEISGTERLVIQTNININRGNSGGPLLDMNGNVVGMMSFRIGNLGVNVQGMSFAIPSNVICEYIETEIESII
ncbi:MAG: trypsin-like peptidase domain-containing protein [Methanomassiliicoccaceae archaeon]|nr:trypsin-like peptidase domain-containing protein [Methanomassiliicoccaceae archaeon]